MRTFSPSDLCFEAGWIVHQQDSPCMSFFKPTSNASLSFDVLVDKQVKYLTDNVLARNLMKDV